MQFYLKLSSTQAESSEMRS